VKRGGPAQTLTAFLEQCNGENMQTEGKVSFNTPFLNFPSNILAATYIPAESAVVPPAKHPELLVAHSTIVCVGVPHLDRSSTDVKGAHG
jgi:hypothetical protein